MEKAYPKSMWLTVNRRCNFRCRWCYAEATGYKAAKEMSFELAVKLAKTAKEVGVSNLLLIGGEPTLWQPLAEFNDFCNREEFRSVLITNGSQFGSDRLFELYQAHPNSKMGLSLKASTAEQLQKVVRAKNFDFVKRGIERAIQKLNAQVSITYNTFYVDNLIDMVQFAVDCGAKTVKIDFCSTTFAEGHPSAKYMVEPRELVANIVRDYPRMEQVTNRNIVFEMMIPFCLWPTDFISDLRRRKQLLSVCHVHNRKGIVFDESGNLLICNALFDYPIGRYDVDFCDSSSFLSWLNSPKISNYYERMGCYPSLTCRECLWYSECGGGCPLRWAMYKPQQFIRI